jgi:hypothetical protein
MCNRRSWNCNQWWSLLSTSAVFGKRKEPHTIIIAQGNTVRHFTIRPWVAAMAGAILAAIAVGYLLATTYLVLRDDILHSAVARQARMQHAYEDRIAALRSQVDRITSYRLLDQQIMESKVAELITRQSILASRSSRLAPLLDKAESNGINGLTKDLDLNRVPVPASTSNDSQRTLFKPQAPVNAGIEKADLNTGHSDHDIGVPLLTLSRAGNIAQLSGERSTRPRSRAGGIGARYAA